MYDEEEAYNLPETTIEEVIIKIEVMTGLIYGDWSDPRNELGEIIRLIGKLKRWIVE